MDFFFQISLFELFQQKNLILTFVLFSFLMIKLRMSPHHSKSGTHLKSPSKMQVRLDTWFMLRVVFLKPDVVIFPGQTQQYLSCRCALKTCERFPTIFYCATPCSNIGHHSRCYVAFSVLHDNVFWKFVVSIPIKRSYVLSCGHNTTQLPSHYSTNGWATKYHVGTQAFPTPPFQGTTWPCVI